MRIGDKFAIYVSATSAEMAYLKLNQILHNKRMPDGGVSLDRMGIALVCPYIDFLMQPNEFLSESESITPLSTQDMSKYDMNMTPAISINGYVNAKVMGVLQNSERFNVTRCIWGGMESKGIYTSNLVTTDNAPLDSNYDVMDNYGVCYAEDIALSEALKTFRVIAKNIHEKRRLVAEDYTLRVVCRKDRNVIAGRFTWRRLERPQKRTEMLVRHQNAYIMIGNIIK